ncbi:hypothetical protein SLEP1_g23447 [Rubroshorea leprosula]|uniref:Uncharacterized protein n=1 Tax=Rubroshorea leprosula TaxID=152421 RepID=A0AAV5JCE8_9ROSI|nr:hypothetical protein SLEP1_g23447 [Rubroshorea leprosula]
MVPFLHFSFLSQNAHMNGIWVFAALHRGGKRKELSEIDELLVHF